MSGAIHRFKSTRLGKEKGDLQKALERAQRANQDLQLQLDKKMQTPPMESLGVGEMKALQALLDETFLPRRSCDRRGPLPQRLRLRAAQAAARRRNDGRSSRPGGECYLFHGTSWASAQRILDQGFDLDLCGRATAERFGPNFSKAPLFPDGLYFAECSSKADEYAEGPSDCGWHALLLCRVLLGAVRLSRRAAARASRRAAEAAAHAEALPGAVLVDFEASSGSYREFILPDASRAFPEYLLSYQRLYRR
eukprot:g27483.t1